MPAAARPTEKLIAAWRYSRHDNREQLVVVRWLSSDQQPCWHVDETCSPIERGRYWPQLLGYLCRLEELKPMRTLDTAPRDTEIVAVYGGLRERVVFVIWSEKEQRWRNADEAYLWRWDRQGRGFNGIADLDGWLCTTPEMILRFYAEPGAFNHEDTPRN